MSRSVWMFEILTDFQYDYLYEYCLHRIPNKYAIKKVLKMIHVIRAIRIYKNRGPRFCEVCEQTAL